MNTDYERKIRLNRNRRIKQLRRRLFVGTGSLLLILIISVSFFSIQAKAESKNATTEYKYFKSVTVTYADSLWNYAVEYSNDGNYEKYINEVMRMNNLNDDNLKIGMNLVVPYFSNDFKE